MGTATLTRSQSRKSRSVSNSEANERGASSPFLILAGNGLDSSSRRSTRKTANALKYNEKENAPPSLSRLTNGGGSERKGLSGSLPQKFSKKRKQSQLVSNGPTSKAITATFADEASLETPVAMQPELCRPRLDVEVAENPAVSQLHSQIELLSDNRLPLAERTCNPCEDQIEVRPKLLNAENSVQQATAVSLGDQGKIASRRKTSNDASAREVLPNSSALTLLQQDYERLFSKYKKLKERRMDEVEALYNEQYSRIADFMQATDALIEYHKLENVSLKQQLEGANSSQLLERCKCLEKANADCRNQLLLEQSKGLELRQENKRLKSFLLEHIADKQKQPAAEPVPAQQCQRGSSTEVIRDAGDGSASSGSSKLVHSLLECMLGLQLSCPDAGVESHLHFEHRPTGFSFDIKEAHDAEIGELVEGGELLYQNVSVGLCKKAVDWMKEKELIFGMNQAQVFLKRLVGYLNRGFYR